MNRQMALWQEPVTLPSLRELTDVLVADFQAVTGSKYLYKGGRDTPALLRLLQSGASPQDIRARWRAGLEAGRRWPGVTSLAQLEARWNDLAGRVPRRLLETQTGPLKAEEGVL